MQPIDLKRQFPKYHITHEEGVQKNDPWGYQIPCQRGLIYPYGPTLLAVQVDDHPKVARRVAALKDVKTIQQGDTEFTFVFPPKRFDAVAALVLPKRKRRISSEVLERLAKGGTGTRFRSVTAQEVSSCA